MHLRPFLTSRHRSSSPSVVGGKEEEGLSQVGWNLALTKTILNVISKKLARRVSYVLLE